MAIDLDKKQIKFEDQGHRSKFRVTGGKQELSTCSDGRPQLKSRPKLETVNK